MARGEFSTSLIVASRNRAPQLAKLLASLPAVSMRDRGVELVLVDSASDDGTLAVMRDFCAAAPFAAKALRVEVPGQHPAQCAGIAAASGDMLAFTDDDCYLAADYFDVLHREVDPDVYQYGSGEIITHDPTDDPRIASTVWWTFKEQKKVIAAGTIFKPGLVQGANMFFLRRVLDRLGGMKVLLGADSDVITALCASLAGFTGVLLRGLVVRHHHGRKRSSPEAIRQLESYVRSRGAYNAFLMQQGHEVPWARWNSRSAGGWRSDSIAELRATQLELEGAAQYLGRAVADLIRTGRANAAAEAASGAPGADAVSPAADVARA